LEKKLSNLFILLMFVLVGWCLWIRRSTWGSMWELPATCAVALSGVGTGLLTPLSANTFGHWFYDLTGMFNLQDFIGLNLIVDGASSLYVCVQTRLVDPGKFHAFANQRLVLPRTIVMQLMAFSFWRSKVSDQFYTDFLDAQADRWLIFFWLLFCGIMAYFWWGAMRGLLQLRNQPESRRVANMFLAAIAGGTVGIVVRSYTLFHNDHDWDDSPQCVFWACFMTSLIAYACAASWRAKTRWFIIPESLSDSDHDPP
jgi:hypothetical protein